MHTHKHTLKPKTLQLLYKMTKVSLQTHTHTHTHTHNKLLLASAWIAVDLSRRRGAAACLQPFIRWPICTSRATSYV